MKLSRPLRILLWPASLLYGAVAAVRTRLYAKGWRKQKHLKGAVISVGNLSVGGTGKTPMVIWLAEKLLQRGKRVAVLTRGYRGSDGTSDEVELMRARLQDRVFFGVGKNRFAQGQFLESKQAIDVFLLDDGFQHLQLARDLNILLLDASRPMGGQALLPSGPMREPLSAVERADVLIFTRTENAAGARDAIQRIWKLPLFSASTVLLGFRRSGDDAFLLKVANLLDGPFFAFCGIGNPEAFERDLKLWGVPIVGKMFFRDHHRYTVEDMRTVEGAAASAGAKALITTEKDSWNLSSVKSSAMPIYIAIIDLKIDGEAAFLASMDRLLEERGALV